MTKEEIREKVAREIRAFSPSPRFGIKPRRFARVNDWSVVDLGTAGWWSSRWGRGDRPSRRDTVNAIPMLIAIGRLSAEEAEGYLADLRVEIEVANLDSELRSAVELLEKHGFEVYRNPDGSAEGLLRVTAASGGRVLICDGVPCDVEQLVARARKIAKRRK